MAEREKDTRAILQGVTVGEGDARRTLTEESDFEKLEAALTPRELNRLKAAGAIAGNWRAGKEDPEGVLDAEGKFKDAAKRAAGAKPPEGGGDLDGLTVAELDELAELHEVADYPKSSHKADKVRALRAAGVRPE
jgi:hypothetical protein